MPWSILAWLGVKWVETVLSPMTVSFEICEENLCRRFPRGILICLFLEECKVSQSGGGIHELEYVIFIEVCDLAGSAAMEALKRLTNIINRYGLIADCSKEAGPTNRAYLAHR